MDSVAQAIGQIVARAPAEIRQEAASTSPLLSMEQRKAQWINGSTPANPVTNCPRCHGRGYFANVNAEGYLVASYCVCMRGKAEVERMRRSGLSGIYQRYRLDNYRTDKPWQVEALRRTKGFVATPKGWLVYSGHSGSGKTHLAVGACGELIQRGHSVRFMSWRAESPKLKAAIGDFREYQKQIEVWKTTEILYVDDFLKSRTITDADVNLSFEILSHRDMANLPTIISTELSIEKICEYDEALGSRIAAQARALYIKTGDVNYRLTG